MRDRRPQRGAALLLVLTTIAILTAVAVDLAYQNRVSLQIAANSRDELRALYLAKSAVSLSRLVLHFQQQLDQASGGLGAALAQVPQQGQNDDQANGEAGVQRRANLTGPEQVAEADRILTRGTQVARRVASMLDEARREHDLMRVTCLDDKLTQVNANLRSATDRAQSLREATQTQDRDRSDHVFTVMTVLGQKFRTLEQEANACVGQDIYETGTTHVETRVDPGTPTDDPDLVPIPGVGAAPFIPPPGCPGA